MASHAISLWRTLWYREQPNDIDRQLDFCYIFFKDKFKASNTLLNNAENTKTKKKSILVPCLKILLGHSNSGVPEVTIIRIVVLYSPAVRAEKISRFPLSPSLLCGYAAMPKSMKKCQNPCTVRREMGCWAGSDCLLRGSFLGLSHRLNMELDLQSLFGLHVHSCTYWLRPRNHPPPRIWAHKPRRYWSAKICRRDLFVTP